MIKRALLIISILLGCLTQASTISENPSTAITKNAMADLVEQKLLPAVVNISTIQQSSSNTRRDYQKDDVEKFFEYFFGRPFPSNPQERKNFSLGSGFIISSDGYIVTNQHVIGNSTNIKVTTNDGKEFTAQIVGVDERTDIAVLKINTNTTLPFLHFKSSSKVRVTDSVLIIGNPYGLGNTVTKGIVSNASRNTDSLTFSQSSKGMLIQEFIQTDAAANPGNSGGPLLDEQGNVIGITFAITSPSGGSAGITFALPSDHAKPIIEELIKKGKISRGIIGVYGVEVNKEIAESIGIPGLKGVLVRKVTAQQTADSGLKAGDVIVKFNGKNVQTMNQLQYLVSCAKMHSIVNVSIIRNGIEKVLSIKILPECSDEPQINKNVAKFSNNYIIFADLDTNTKKITKKGIIVKKVLSNSIDLEEGDIIYNVVGCGDVENLAEWKKICTKYYKKGYKFITVLVQNGKSGKEKCVHLDLIYLIESQ